jgi:hypothetical protein
MLSQKDPNAIGIEMVLTESMKYRSLFRDPASSSKHISILEIDITALATTLFVFQKHQNN